MSEGSPANPQPASRLEQAGEAGRLGAWAGELMATLALTVSGSPRPKSPTSRLRLLVE